VSNQVSFNNPGSFNNPSLNNPGSFNHSQGSFSNKFDKEGQLSDVEIEMFYKIMNMDSSVKKDITEFSIDEIRKFIRSGMY